MYLQVGNTRILQETIWPDSTKKVEQHSALKQSEQKPQESQTSETLQPEKKGSTEKERENALKFALESTKKAEYSLVGADSDIASLDVQKAISDMQKDSILQEYQYFVRSGM